MPGNLNKHTSLALDFRKWCSVTLYRYKNELVDLCQRLNDFYGSDFIERGIGNVILFACARHNTARANLTFLNTYPEFLAFLREIKVGRMINLAPLEGGEGTWR